MAPRTAQQPPGGDADLTESSDAGRHADIGGWYDHDYLRIDGRWRVERMVLHFVWTDGEPFPESHGGKARSD